MERGWRLGGRRYDARAGDGRQQTPQRRFNDRSGSCLGGRRKRGTSEQAFGRSRGGFTCKVHCLSDARGVPLAFHLTPGEAADCAAFEDIYALGDVKPGYILADKGYDTNAIRARIKADGVRAAIPSKSNRVKAIKWNKALYRQRNRIERMIGHLKINRAVATRYDKLAKSFLDALHIAAIRKCLRIVTL
jgi:transposase